MASALPEAISAPWLTEPARARVFAALAEAGFEARAVGGAVRNALLGVPVVEVDMATTAKPDQVIVAAEKAGLKAIPTGLAHGTVTIVADGVTTEVTTLREDVETHGRHATVAFTDDWAADARRRDFTMNALYADRGGRVIDPLHGLPDLEARRVRFVGDAETRIREDYLRILRFFRFHAAYGDPEGGLDPEGLAACAAFSAGLETISRERITAELRKLLGTRDPAPSIAAMAQSGVLASILPGADPRTLAPLVHLDAAQPARWLRRLAVLGGDNEGLRLSKSEARDLASLRTALGSTETPAALGWRLGEPLATDAILARAASFGSYPPEDWQAEARRGAHARFPVTAADLMPALQGEALGARLKALESRWLASNLTLGKDALLKGA